MQKLTQIKLYLKSLLFRLLKLIFTSIFMDV